MATSLVVNGVSYLYPDTGDQSWGTVASAWAAAVTTGMLQKGGGTFTLIADVNFGLNFGLLSKYFTSVSSNPAASGQVRLASADSVTFRNNANSADLALGKNASDQLTWAGTPFLSSGGVALVSAGGTGQTTASAAFNALQPGTTKGDLIVWNGAAAVRFAAGLDGQVLSSLASASSGLSWISPLTNPMTTLGDLISGGASGATTRLAGDTSNTRKFLRSLSSSGVATAPIWDTLLATDIPTLNQNTTGTAANVTGTVAIGNGGTGATTKTAGFDALSPNATKGDLTVRGASSNAALGVGSNNQVLIADSTQTQGMKWAQPGLLITATKTATYTVLSTDDVIFGDATSAAFTLTLPTASGNQGKVIRIKRIDATIANLLTLSRAGSDTIDGKTSILLATKGQTVTLISDGVVTWNVIEHRCDTDWTAYTPTLTASTTNPTLGANTQEVRWRRVGDSIEIACTIWQTSAGTAGSGTYRFSLPAGVTVDTTKMAVFASAIGLENAGGAHAWDGTSGYTGYCYPGGTTWLELILGNTAATLSQNMTSTTLSFANATLRVTFRAKVPITNWSTFTP